MPKKKRSITQSNIDKINRNLLSIAKTFGVDSKPYEIAAQKLFYGGFETYDKIVDGIRIIQMSNNKKNRQKHQTIRKITKERQSINKLKRKYAPLTSPEEEPEYEEGTGEEPHETFLQWYSRISSNFMDAIDEIYALQDSLEFYSIPYDDKRIWYDEDYQQELWHEVYDKLISDTLKAKEFYDQFGFGIDEESGDVVTVSNTADVNTAHPLDLTEADSSFFEWMQAYTDIDYGE